MLNLETLVFDLPEDVLKRKWAGDFEGEMRLIDVLLKKDIPDMMKERLLVEKRKYASEEEKESCIQNGILYASGMIAGEGVVGILLAVVAVLGLNLDLSGVINLGNIGGLAAFALLLGSILFFCNKGKQSTK